jgi:hypothetical protein
MRLVPRGKRELRQAATRLTIILLALVGGLAVVLGWGTRMPGRSFIGPRPPVDADEAASRGRLRADVVMLAGTIGERNTLYRRHLDQAAEHLTAELRGAGYAVREQAFAVDGVTVRNLETEQRGTTRPDEIVVVGGHYDSVVGSPGADDNATGAAMVIELARLFARRPTARSIRFVCFTNEEPPHFKSTGMGSRQYASLLAREHAHVVAMFSLETLGHFSDSPGSQRFPLGLGWFYPKAGSFAAFVGNLASRREVREAVRVFRETSPRIGCG